MTLDTHDNEGPSIGVDVANLERYTAIESEDDVIVYDERVEDAWIQSDDWIDVAAAA